MIYFSSDSQVSTTQVGGIESRIDDMKNQFQKSYDLFMKAHLGFSNISFQNLKVEPNSEEIDFLPQKDIDDILNAKSLDGCLENLKTKLNVKTVKTAPEFQEFMNIITELHSGMKSLEEYQNKLGELNQDLNQKIDQLNLNTSETLNEIEKLAKSTYKSSSESQDSSDEIEDDESSIETDN